MSQRQQKPGEKKKNNRDPICRLCEDALFECCRCSVLPAAEPKQNEARGTGMCGEASGDAKCCITVTSWQQPDCKVEKVKPSPSINWIGNLGKK